MGEGDRTREQGSEAGNGRATRLWDGDRSGSWFPLVSGTLSAALAPAATLATAATLALRLLLLLTFCMELLLLWRGPGGGEELRW